MVFSVNQLWERCEIPDPELSITLSAPVCGKREFFLSLSGESQVPDFMIVPHFKSDWTITVRGIRPAPERFETGVIEAKPFPPRRPVRIRPLACRSPLRL